jgi:hypothetical protein
VNFGGVPVYCCQQREDRLHQARAGHHLTTKSFYRGSEWNSNRELYWYGLTLLQKMWLYVAGGKVKVK